MKNIPLLIGTLIGGLIFLIAVVFAFSNMANKPADLSVVQGDMKFTMGKSDAKVTIVEFSDFQCPACAAAHPLVEKIVKNNPEVKVVYRFFPLVSIHANTQAASRAAFAASTFNKFWEYQKILFEKQLDWSEEKDPTNKFVEYAQSLSIDKAEFLSKLQETKDEADKVIAKDVQDATTLGLPGTPSFFVNGQKVDVASLESAVENASRK